MEQIYFRSIRSIQLEGAHCQIYRPIHSPAVLTSRQGVNLAAIGFLYLDPSSSRQPVLVYNSNETGFQCLFPEPEKDFKIIISNLSEHRIKIDIGIKNKAVTELDPGIKKGYLNAVNELAPRETFEIIKKQNEQPFNLTLSTIYVSVVPQAAPEFVSLFSNIYWHCPEYILIRDSSKTRQLSSLAEQLNKLVDLIDSSTPIHVLSHELASLKKPFVEPEYPYVYDVPSNRSGKLCSISLVACPNLVVSREISTGMIINLIVSHFRDAQLGKKKTKTLKSTCVVCSMGYTDIVLYRCNHFAHSNCLENKTICPDCQAYITATAPRFQTGRQISD